MEGAIGASAPADFSISPSPPPIKQLIEAKFKDSTFKNKILLQWTPKGVK